MSIRLLRRRYKKTIRTTACVFGIVLLTDQLPTVTARISDALRSNGFGWLVDAG